MIFCCRYLCAFRHPPLDYLRLTTGIWLFN
uniref:Uncharacterized protein n=1 Tax=Anguilla anguilla TaxID=7936 RepID=A0A0E9WI94_ANGAN